MDFLSMEHAFKIMVNLILQQAGLHNFFIIKDK